MEEEYEGRLYTTIRRDIGEKGKGFWRKGGRSAPSIEALRETGWLRRGFSRGIYPFDVLHL